MVTHDVDEAIFLADRIVMMTNDPEAEVGGILHVPFPRPRDRKAVMALPEYYELRDQLIGFLETHAHKKPRAESPPKRPVPPPPPRAEPRPHLQNPNLSFDLGAVRESLAEVKAAATSSLPAN